MEPKTMKHNWQKTEDEQRLVSADKQRKASLAKREKRERVTAVPRTLQAIWPALPW